MRITLTGFGVFPGVTENPTELIIKNLQEKNSSLASDYHILKVSVEDVLEYCSNQNLSSSHEDGDGQDQQQQPHLIIHLGVNASIDCMNFERNAYNNMTFRVQDEAGYQPENQCIVSDYPLDESLQTDFNLDSIVDQMRNSYHYPCNVSTNPGRYLCNYIYFQSLIRAQQCGTSKYILFLHVPPLDVMSLEEQIKFIELSIPLLAEQVQQQAAAAINNVTGNCG
jgi:pyroglutamyl-peptidase